MQALLQGMSVSSNQSSQTWQREHAGGTQSQTCSAGNHFTSFDVEMAASSAFITCTALGLSSAFGLRQALYRSTSS